MTIESFIKNNYRTREYKINRSFKTLLKSILPADAELFGFSKCFYYTSGFVKLNNKFVYISISDVRFNSNWYNNILIRTATDENDYRGGRNQYTDIYNLKDNIIRLSK